MSDLRARVEAQGEASRQQRRIEALRAAVRTVQPSDVSFRDIREMAAANVLDVAAAYLAWIEGNDRPEEDSP